VLAASGEGALAGYDFELPLVVAGEGAAEGEGEELEASLKVAVAPGGEWDMADDGK
jgi:hypothetical protein